MFLPNHRLLTDFVTAKTNAPFWQFVTESALHALRGNDPRFLGGDLLPSANACVCKAPWVGSACDKNPCASSPRSCSGHGSCYAHSETESRCKCDVGFSGAGCATSCNGKCGGGGGVYPFGCAGEMGPEVRTCAGEMGPEVFWWRLFR